MGCNYFVHFYSNFFFTFEPISLSSLPSRDGNDEKWTAAAFGINSAAVTWSVASHSVCDAVISNSRFNCFVIVLDREWEIKENMLIHGSAWSLIKFVDLSLRHRIFILLNFSSSLLIIDRGIFRPANRVNNR